MRTFFVVPPDPIANAVSCLTACLKCIEIDAIILQGSPQSFNHDIVYPAASAVHGDLHVSVRECLGKRNTCKLAALISVEYCRLAVFGKGLLEGCDAEVCIKSIAEPPA